MIPNTPNIIMKVVKPDVRFGTVVVVVDVVVVVVVEVSVGKVVSDICENNEEGISSYIRKDPVSLIINVTPNVGDKGEWYSGSPMSNR
jgi:hypothetical protein